MKHQGLPLHRDARFRPVRIVDSQTGEVKSRGTSESRIEGTEGRDYIARVDPALVGAKVLLRLCVVVERDPCGSCKRYQPNGISRRKT
jgi:hypothetical protein